MRLALIFNKTRADTIGVYFERACRRLQIPYTYMSLGQALEADHAHDLYVRIDHGDDYTVRLPEQLRPSALYAIDTHLPHNRRKIRQLARHFDLVWYAQGSGGQVLPKGEWLPVGCDPAFYGSLGGAMAWDVAFVGNDGGLPRKFYLQALRERYPKSFIGRAEPTQLGAVYSRARLGFNYSIADDVNMRMFEVMACGTLLITNALHGDDVQRLGLHDRKHLVLYHQPEELFGLIDHYVAHPEERQAIARAGAQIVRERHTYDQRLQQLLERASRCLGVRLGDA